MKANIKLAPWIPIIVVLVLVLFLIEGFDVLDVVLILGGGFIISYFVLGYLRRKEALIIDDKSIQVRTPIKFTEFALQDITTVFIKEHDHDTLKAVYHGETVTLCTNIYDCSIEEIKTYLIEHNTHITEQEKEVKQL